MKSIITQLSRQEAWEEFLAYRLLKGRFCWHEFHDADRFVELQQFLPLAERIARGGIWDCHGECSSTRWGLEGKGWSTASRPMRC